MELLSRLFSKKILCLCPYHSYIIILIISHVSSTDISSDLDLYLDGLLRDGVWLKKGHRGTRLKDKDKCGPFLSSPFSPTPLNEVNQFIYHKPSAPCHNVMPQVDPKNNRSKLLWTENSEILNQNKLSSFKLYFSGICYSDKKLTKT